MSKALHLPLLSVVVMLAGACSRHAALPGLTTSGVRSEALPAPPPTPLAPGDGLEITVFISGVSEHALATALLPYADQPPRIPRELFERWSAHGIRLVAVPIADTGTLVKKLQTTGTTQRQWLGQAFTWTEAVREPEGGPGEEIVALDAERIRLAPGVLRLLVRSWIEPAPPEPAVGAVTTAAQHAVAPSAPTGALWIELLPQHEESNRDDALHPFADLESRLETEQQGLNFSRLYTRLRLPSDCALLVVSERPGTQWGEIAAEPEPAAQPAPEDSATKDTGAGDSRPQRIGEVTRGAVPPRAAVAPGTQPAQAAETRPGPPAVRVPTLGEAMLTRQNRPLDSGPLDAPQRTIAILIPRVPAEYQLLAPVGAPPPPAQAPARNRASTAAVTPARP